MTQPDNFGFGEEETMLRDSAARFFADNLPVDQLHALARGLRQIRFRERGLQCPVFVLELAYARVIANAPGIQRGSGIGKQKRNPVQVRKLGFATGTLQRIALGGNAIIASRAGQ